MKFTIRPGNVVPLASAAPAGPVQAKKPSRSFWFTAGAATAVVAIVGVLGLTNKGCLGTSMQNGFRRRVAALLEPDNQCKAQPEVGNVIDSQEPLCRTLEGSAATIAAKDSEIDKLKGKIAAKDKALAAKDQELSNKDDAIAECEANCPPKSDAERKPRPKRSAGPKVNSIARVPIPVADYKAFLNDNRAAINEALLECGAQKGLEVDGQYPYHLKERDRLIVYLRATSVGVNLLDINRTEGFDETAMIGTKTFPYAPPSGFASCLARVLNSKLDKIAMGLFGKRVVPNADMDDIAFPTPKYRPKSGE